MDLEDLSPQQRLDRLKAYMDRIRKRRRPSFEEGAESMESFTESIAHSRDDRTAEVHEAMYRGGSTPTLESIEHYEALIIPELRPVLDLVEGEFQDPPPLWSLLDTDAVRDMIRTAAGSVGRLEVVGHPRLAYVGTAFVVGEGLVLTNRHVAEHFVQGTGRGLTFMPGRDDLRVDFKRDVTMRGRERVQVVGVEWVHPLWDAALLRLEHTEGRAPLTLDADAAPEALEGRPLAIIGFPYRDPRNDTRTQDELFRHIYGVKRLQPGDGLGALEIASFGRVVGTLGHDASTLGGNSGSVVLDLSTGRAVGLHFGGIAMEANHAVSARDLVSDDRVVDGLRIVGDPPDPPEGLGDLWAVAGAGGATAGAPPSAGGGPSAAVSSSEDAAGVDAFGWYEAHDDARIATALEEQPDRTREILRRALGAAEGDEVAAALSAETQEFVFSRQPALAELPEILFLHGIMGSHLADDLTSGRRIWLDPRAFARGNIANAICLKPDGVTDDLGVRLRADGHLGLSYRRAARALRGTGHIVHTFSYDWRKPLEVSAGTLHHFIEARALQRPDARFVIVAHSMGGLVAATYAATRPSWADRVEAAVLVGSPLGGSFTPLQAVQGDYPFFGKLAWFSRKDTAEELQVASSTMPGLLTMLPDPGLIPDASPCYQAERYFERSRPQQRWLDHSEAAKAMLRGSPLLSRATAIVCGDLPTVVTARVTDGSIRAGAADGRGDGTVPLACSAIPELDTVYSVSRVAHDGLLNDWTVINAVQRLVAGEAPDLVRLTADAQESTGLLESAGDPQVLATDAAMAVKERVQGGKGTAADYRWLLHPGYPPAPGA